jgi:hypothetical protein
LQAKVTVLMDEMLALIAESAQIQKGISAQAVSNISDSDVRVVLNKYCAGTIKIDYKKTDYSAEFTKKLDALKAEELMANLNKGTYIGNQLPEALQYFGLKLMQGGLVDSSVYVYTCAAEKYFDMFAMYRLASIQKNGTDSIKKQLPNAVIKNDLKPDNKQAYFWLSSAMFVESAEKTGLLRSDTSAGWNYVALLDDLQNTGKLTAKQMTDIEKLTRGYIGRRYPEVLK